MVQLTWWSISFRVTLLLFFTEKYKDILNFRTPLGLKEQFGMKFNTIGLEASTKVSQDDG